MANSPYVAYSQPKSDYRPDIHNHTRQNLCLAAYQMNSTRNAMLGAGVTFPVCAVITTPSGDPLTMIILGTTGAVLAFFLFWWLLTRRAIASWGRGRQIALSGVITAFVTLAVYVLAHISAS